MEAVVRDGGKTGAETGVKLAYKFDFAPVFPSKIPGSLRMEQKEKER